MSIINRLKPNGHLDDADFAEIWTDISLTGAAATNPHLHCCPECQSRFAVFSAWIQDVRGEAAAEADAAFPAERLSAQQSSVLRRLEAAEHPARVIAFPKFARPISSTASHGRRWIAAAAAACFVVGVAVGQLMDLRHALAPADRPATARVAASAPQRGNPAVTPVSAVLTDDALMARIEDLADADGAVPDSLMALDSVTPRARDYASRSR